MAAKAIKVNVTKERIANALKTVNQGVQALCSLFPVNPRRLILYSSPDFYDNAWAFYHYLEKNGYLEKYDVVWLVYHPERLDASAAHFIPLNQYRSILKRSYYIATASCVIYTHNCPVFHQRKNQTLINTTHAASRLKSFKVGKYKKGTKWGDIILRCGQVGVDRYNQDIHLPLDRYQIIGMPRLDLLYEHEDCLDKVIDGYKGETVVISMETFKQNKNYDDSTSDDCYAINVVHTQEELVKLNRYLAEHSIILLVKIHHMQDLSFLDRVELSNIRYLTDEALTARGVQLYRLLECCHALLTDYSTIYFDYLLLDRPVGFMLADIEEYKRGFIIEDPTVEMPGEKLGNLEELIAFLQHVIDGEDPYSPQRIALRNVVFKYQDNLNCQRLMDLLLERKILR